MEAQMEVQELRTAKEVREKAREINRRLRAQRERRTTPVVAPAPIASPEIKRLIVIKKKPSIKIPVHAEHVVQNIVAIAHNMTALDIRGPNRRRPFVNARHIAIWISRQMQTGERSLAIIARRFGKRDHTTILHSIRRIDAERAKSTELAQRVDALLAECKQANRKQRS